MILKILRGYDPLHPHRSFTINGKITHLVIQILILFLSVQILLNNINYT